MKSIASRVFSTLVDFFAGALGNHHRRLIPIRQPSQTTNSNKSKRTDIKAKSQLPSKPISNEMKSIASRVFSTLVDFFAGALGNHPRTTLLTTVCLILPILSYFAIYPVQIETDVRRGFAQKGGRGEDEFKAFAKYFNMSYKGLEIWVVLAIPKANRGETQLQMSGKLLSETERLDKFVRNFAVPYGNEIVTFKEMASDEELNYQFEWYNKAYGMKDILPGINLTYPVADVLGNRLILASHFFEVNKGMDVQTGEIKTVQSIALWYMSRAPNYPAKKRLEAVQWALFEEFLKDNFSTQFSVQMYGDQVANAEMLRGTLTTAALFSVGMLLMIGFMAFNFSHMTIVSKIWMTFGAIIAPGLATATAFAIVGWTGVGFNSIMCITPFLVLGIGVDDAFLLLHNWRQSRKEGFLSEKIRMRRVFSEIGPSMAITSLTNTMAFGVGLFSPTAQMSAFCLCTAIAVFMDFVYEFLIFTPIMVIYHEEKMEKDSVDKTSLLSYRAYVKALFSIPGRVFIMCVVVLLYTFATIGLLHMRTSFDPSKTFPSDSHLLSALESFERIQTEYWPINVVTRKPPKNIEEWRAWEEMLQRLENRSHCYGPERTINFLREYYKEQLKRDNSTKEFSFNSLRSFLKEHMVGDQVVRTRDDENGTVEVTSTNYVVICRVFPLPSGDTDWERRARLLQNSRDIVDAYPSFESTVFDYDSTLYDIIISVKSELLKAVLLTFVCMIVICIFTIPNLIGISLATLSMLSISYCMLGFLSLWGCDLDPIVMINVLMAIGFSVDFSAHICYHYHKSIQNPLRETPVDWMAHILHAVGRPMIEASVSTMLCMIPLFFVNIYIITSFAKTVCLVASVGLLHGLVILPFILSLVRVKSDISSSTSTTSDQPSTLSREEQKHLI